MAALASAFWAAPTYAVVHSAAVLDGPANNIVEVDGAALAPDGSGGVVYRKQAANGVAHVFVVPFANGRWGEPVQADTSDLYGANEPAIAAGNGGRLLVVWVQARNVSPKGVTLYSLMGASMQPGASSFGEAATVDSNVGEPYTGDISGVDPRLAMNPTSGQAYAVYRVTRNDCLTFGGDPLSSICPPGKLVDVRVARFEYLRWSSLGTINRAPQQAAMRDPTASNAPSIGIDLSGNGVVAWQEPDAGNVARIWVRRLFGALQGNVLEASPEAVNGHAVTSDAEAPVVADSPYGEARIALRVEGAPGSAVATPQLFVNSISSALGLNASRLNGPVPVAGATAGDLGLPSAAIDLRGNYRVSWTAGQGVDDLAGNLDVTGSPVGIGATSGQIAPTTINPAGGGTTAWPTSANGLPAVEVREDYAEGAWQDARLAGTIPGPVGGVSLGGSGQGDALLAWTVGPPGHSEMMGDFVQAPPAPFNAVTPTGWVRGSGAVVSWETSPDAVVGVTYAVYVDGKPRIAGLTGLSAHLDPRGLGDGAHRVQVLATDAAGQQTMSTERALKVDANPPIVRVELVDHRRGVRVLVSDKASGVDARAVVISFGDGRSSRGHASAVYKYARAGTYTIAVQVRDHVGNQTTDHLRVRAL